MPRASGKDRFVNVTARTSEVKEHSPSPSTASAKVQSPLLERPEQVDQLDVAYRDTVQLNVNVSPALRKAIRLKALEEGVPVTVALRQVLQRWVESK